MAFLKLGVSVLLIILFVIIGMLFVFHNSAPVSVDFFVIQISSIGVGWWISLSLILGILLGWLSVLPVGVLQKLSIKNKQRKLESQATELSRLKGVSMKGN